MFHEVVTQFGITVTATRATAGTSLQVSGGPPGDLVFPCTLLIYNGVNLVTGLTATAWSGQTVTISSTIPPGYVDAQCNPAYSVLLPQDVVRASKGTATALTIVTSFTPPVIVPYASTTTFDCSTSNFFIVTLGGSPALVLANITPGQTVKIKLIEDGTGSRTVSAWFTAFTTVHWAGGSAPTLTTTANHADYIEVTCLSSTVLDCKATLNYA